MTATGIATAFEVRRWYDAPLELIFRAMTDPATLPQWLCPNPRIRLDVLEIDLRVGGRYRFSYVEVDGTVRSIVHGRYRVIDAARQFAFTWTWEAPDPDAGVETLVTFDLRARNGGTEVTVTHICMPNDEKARAHQNGWTACLSILGAVVDRQQTTTLESTA